MIRFSSSSPLVLAFAIAIVSGLASQASFAQDEGSALAKRYCINCHEVAPGVKPEKPINPEAPSFIVIAKDPQKYPELKLAAVLTGPHAKMEPFAFTADQRLSLISYIKALAK